MRAILGLILFAILFVPIEASAYQEVIEVVKSTATNSGFKCSSGTATEITALDLSGFNQAGLRITNIDSTAEVYIGFTAEVSTDTSNSLSLANLGERLGKDGSGAPYSIGKKISVFCKGADACGADGCILTIVKFGYK